MQTQNRLTSDTITAQATPAGQGGIAVVRVSGPLVKEIMPAILGRKLSPRCATYLPFYDENGTVIDEGVALFFPHPHSFTGEDTLELQGHGGRIVVGLLLQRILSLGARLAQPGEFSERAFLNGKMDLAQAEAIADLIHSSSVQAARLAMRSLQGEFSKEVHRLCDKVMQLRIYIEAAIDFSDEEIDFLAEGKIIETLTVILQDLALIQKQAKQGSLLRAGLTAVIVGAPNVGKSSLLNCLSGKELAIVTDIPGTTRDVLKDNILIDDIPIQIIDTAGLRASNDVVEQEGIRRAYQEMTQADLILYLLEASDHAFSFSKVDLPEVIANHQTIFIRNKIDLTGEQATIQQMGTDYVVSLSAKSQEGMELLKNCIKTIAGFQSHLENIYLARDRHLHALAQAETHVTQCLTQLKDGQYRELAAEDLRLAQLALGEITGTVTADDLLGQIFSSFCIGK